ncbi:MAG: MFS transporter [Nocardioides sp.]
MTGAERQPDEAQAEAEDSGRSGKWLTPGVAAVGLASLGSDAGHEMTTSLLPTFLSSTLHSGPAALGAIEGVADALVGLSKLAGGPLSSDPARRGRIASGGYLLTAAATAAIAFTTAVWQVALLRGLAWMSRGLRSPARDSMLMSMVPRAVFGRASGLERAGDNLGALIGPLLASALVASIGVRHTLLLAFVPGLLAAGAITVAAHEARRVVTSAQGQRTLSFNIGELRRAGLVRALAPATLFELGNLATTLLILRTTGLLHTDARSLTAATSLAILMYAGHNAVAAVAALVGGSWTDRASPRLVFATGAVAYVLAYTIFAWGPSQIWLLLLAFASAGLGIGLAETAESVTVALALPDRLRGNGFGMLGLVQSFGDLGATLVAGLIWSFWSPTAAFTYAALWMVTSVVASRLVVPRSNHTEEDVT